MKFSRKHGFCHLAEYVTLLIILLFIFGCKIFQQQAEEIKPAVIGVIADIQYADKDTGGKRHYRTSLNNLRECVSDFNDRTPIFVIQLGDIVDGHSNDKERSRKDLDLILSAYNQLTIPAYHVVGNHCLSVGSESLSNAFGLSSFYYDYTVPGAKGWRFFVLDGNDAGYGIIGSEQLEWFRSGLHQAALNGEKVLVFCHFALLKEAAGNHRMAESEALLEAMDATGCVVAWFAGHDHAGGYALRNDVHHLTFKGMVESPVNNAYALVELYPERINVIGFGDEPSRNLIILPAIRPGKQ